MSERSHCRQVHTVVFGQKPDQTDGILFISMKNNEILCGTKENPGGLVKDVAMLKRWFWIMSGVFTTLNVLIKLLPAGALHKILALL